jgi:RNA polymerase sigma factor (sigma-70 family)
MDTAPRRRDGSVGLEVTTMASMTDEACLQASPRAGLSGAAGHRRSSVTYLRSVSGDSYPDWEAIYLDNVERLYRMMFSRVGNRPDAEDLTAEVFRAALGPLRTSASVGEVRAYLLTTARTVLASHWRRRYSVEISSIDVEAELASPREEPPQESDAPARVTNILAELPERYERILELRFLQSCSLKEAARAMNISLSNAKVLQHRALRRAAQLMEEAR